MIVTGSSPPYKHDWRSPNEPGLNFAFGKPLFESRSEEASPTNNAPVEINSARKRPKSSPLKMSEKILKSFSMEHTGTGITFSEAKLCVQNSGTSSGVFRRKGKFHLKMVQPGYMMTKKEDGINVTLNLDELCANASKGKMKSSLQDERAPTMKSLQQEVRNLKGVLNEERISHRSQFRQFIENTKVDVQVMLQEHRDHIKMIEEDHKEELENLTDTYESKLMERKAMAEFEAAGLQNEIDAMKEKLNSCKEDVLHEMNEKWLIEKKELAADNYLKTEEMLEQQRLKLEHFKAVELGKLKQDHEGEIKKLDQVHHQEIKAVLEKFVACAEDGEKLKVVQSERERLKQEVDELRELYCETKKQLKKTQNDLADAKVKLQAYELSFSEKVAEVEERYAMKIHGLMLNNTDIRRNYMKKCTELLDVQTKTDFVQKRTTKIAKDKMKTVILARAKTDISLINSAAEKGERVTWQSTRPKSAPPTQRHISLHNTSPEPLPSPPPPYRPNSSLT